MGWDVRYILSRVYMHNPPPPQRARVSPPTSRHQSHDSEEKRSRGEDKDKEPEANPWVLIVVLLLGIAIMAATTEWVSVLCLERSWSD